MKFKRLCAVFCAAGLALSGAVAALPEPCAVYAEDLVYNGMSYEIEDGAVTITGHTDDLPAELVIPAEIDGLPVTGIGESAFTRCEYLTSVTIPDSVTSIGHSSFSNCSSLQSIIIPSGITCISKFMFAGCTSLSSIIIPESITKIDDYAFADCSSLTGITVPDGISNIGYDAFAGSALTSIAIPGEYVWIQTGAFAGCVNLQSVILPESGHIGESAFSGCTALIDITIPKGINWIDGFAFQDTLWLTEKRTENPIVIINDIVVDGQTCQGDVTIPSSARVIVDFAFAYCTEITNITIPAYVSINSRAFWMCSEDFTIRGYCNSDAEAYALEHNIRFEALSKTPITINKTGDLSGNGEIGADDAQMTLKAYVNILAEKDTGLTEAQKKAADVDGDGEITATDAQIILKYYVNTLAGKDVTWEQLIPKKQ